MKLTLNISKYLKNIIKIKENRTIIDGLKENQSKINSLISINYFLIAMMPLLTTLNISFLFIKHKN